jgi:hypothetical protein
MGEVLQGSVLLAVRQKVAGVYAPFFLQRKKQGPER